MDVDREHGYLFAKFEGDNKPKDKIDQSGDLALTIEQNLGILSALKREHVVYADKINIIPLPDSGSNTSNTGDASSANESSNASSKPETAPATPLTSTSPTSESTTDIATDTGAGAATGAASTHSVSSGSSSTSNPVLVHDNAIANQMLFAQLNFLPTLINHGVGFWSTVDSINTEYQQVKYQGEQISLGYAKAVKLGNTTYILGVGFHINTIKNKASHFDVTTQQYAVSLYDTLQFNHGFFIDVSGFVGQTHGRTQFVIGPFAFNNRFKTTNIGMALQLGKVFELSDRFQLTPKLGLIYEHLGRYDFVNDAGIRYEGSASNVTLANASLRLDWQATPALKPFGAIEYTHALKSSMLVRVSQNTTEFSAQSQAPKDITKLALGIKWQIKPTLAAQFNLNTAFGPERRKTYGLGASIAWRF